jgi:hypothetical protein
VVTHHTTVAGDFTMTRSQWLIRGQDKGGKPVEVHHHGMEVHRKLPDGTWVFFIDHPFGADPCRRGSAPHRVAPGSEGGFAKDARAQHCQKLRGVLLPHLKDRTSWVRF